MRDKVTPAYVLKWALSGILALTLVALAGVGANWGLSIYGRSQALADARNQAQINLVKANNEVATTQIQINTQAQQLRIHQEQAQIRQADAVGVREAQDEIAKTLTPLYVQWEMTQALEDIAKSGRNSSVIYIPSGAGGVPLVSTSNPSQVASPQQ